MIYHGGLDKISKSNKKNEVNVNEAEILMEELGVIDLIITAHQHQTLVGQDHGTVYVQAGQNAEELVHVKIKFKNELIHMRLRKFHQKSLI